MIDSTSLVLTVITIHKNGYLNIAYGVGYLAVAGIWLVLEMPLHS
jgi:hypothetical protein